MSPGKGLRHDRSRRAAADDRARRRRSTRRTACIRRRSRCRARRARISPTSRASRVLLVDDDADALADGEGRADDRRRDGGHRVERARRAGGARSRTVRRRRPRHRPAAGDGYELLERSGSGPRAGRATSPAALTAYARAIDRTRSLQAGFQMHLSKPVQPTELAAAVLALTGRDEGSHVGSRRGFTTGVHDEGSPLRHGPSRASRLARGDL